MIDSRAQMALLFLWEAGYSVLVRTRPIRNRTDVEWFCMIDGKPTFAMSRDRAIEDAARSVGWSG